MTRNLARVLIDLARMLIASAVFVGIVSAAASPAAAAMRRRHTHLIRSTPAENETLKVTPKEIRLTFEGKIDLTVSAVTLSHAGGSAVDIGKLTVVDSGDDAILVAPIGRSLMPGDYNVTWKTASKHGHNAKGKFRFTLRAASKVG
jgi:methionine-rich copper-binding protein CopC